MSFNVLETPKGPDDPILMFRAQTPCRICRNPSPEPFLDLGQQPLCESFLPPEQLNEVEPFYPLTVFVCKECLLVQLQAYVSTGADRRA